MIFSLCFPYLYCSPGRQEKLLFFYLLWNLFIDAANKNSNEFEIIDERVERWQLTGIMRMLPSKNCTREMELAGHMKKQTDGETAWMFQVM